MNAVKRSAILFILAKFYTKLLLLSMVRLRRWMFQRSAVLKVLAWVKPTAKVSLTTVIKLAVCSLLICENGVVCFFMTFCFYKFLMFFSAFGCVAYFDNTKIETF